MSKYKRYIKNIFSIAGVEWADGKEPTTLQDGIIISQYRADTDTQRRTIADRQYIVSLDNLAKNVLIPIILPQLDPIYNTDVEDERTDKDVGNIPAGTPVEDLENRPVNEILDDIFFTDFPFILAEASQFMTKDQPADLVEVGASIQFDVIAAHFRGIIRSADLAPDIELQGDAFNYTFEDYTGTITVYGAPVTNSQNHIGDVFPAVLGPMSMKCLITWEEGDGDYYDEFGRPNHAFDLQRVGGNEEVMQTVDGRYKAFYGSGILGSAPTLPIDIRALPAEFLEEDGTGAFSMTIPAGDAEAYFYLPDTQTAEVFHEKEANTYLTSGFTVTPVAMEDGGANPIGYSLWKLEIGGLGYTTDALFNINIL